MNKAESTEYGEEYCFKDVEAYEKIAGFKVNEAFKAGWLMARVKNKNLGITEKEENE